MSKLTISDLENIVSMFGESDWNVMELSYDGCDLFLSKSGAGRPSWSAEQPQPAPLTMPTPAPAAPAESAAPAETASPATPTVEGGLEIPPGCQVIRAPSLGTFYRSAKPGAEPFVEIGQAVEEDTELCLIEVMKLFTTLRACMKGKIHKILVEDGALVESNQPLFLVDTNG